MTTTPETFQQTFVTPIVSIISQAYNAGVLQYHPMTIADITVELTIFHHFNQLTLRFNNRLLSVSIFDTDDEATQTSTIQNLVADIIA